MTRYLPQEVCFFVLTALVLTIHAQNISDPYFFQNHTQRCNCEPNIQCDNDTGVCIPDACAQPYLGVNCQHADVNLTMSDPPEVPPELLDGDDRTCLTSPLDGKVVYKFEEPTHFIWAFVSRHECEPMQPNIVLYNKDVKLDVQTYFLRIHPHSLLIKTRQDVMYTRLELSNLPDDTCSLEVSLGRNLALSSTDAQTSSVYHRIPNKLRPFHAYRAIDGNDNSSFTRTSQCIHTKVSPKKQSSYSWWKAKLHRDARINAVLIVNRGFLQCRMWDSVFKIFAPNTTEVASYNIAPTPIEKSIYTFQTPVLDSIREVQISVRKNSTYTSCKKHGILSLCEIYVYGEFRCPDGTYGARCERSYPEGCSPEQCDPDWGCPRECKVDVDASCTTNCTKYGDVCELLCSENCKGDGRCARYTGECLEGCKLGFYRPNCTVPCPAGYFGENCTEHCVNCKKDNITDQHQCDREYGDCLDGCADGYSGDNCTTIETASAGFSFPFEFLLYGLLPLLFLLCLFALVFRRRKQTENEEESAKMEQLPPTQPETNTEAINEPPATTQEADIPGAQDGVGASADSNTGLSGMASTLSTISTGSSAPNSSDTRSESTVTTKSSFWGSLKGKAF